jgi:Tc toxin complex TcA C-terminal TcB-binding domain
MSQYGSGNGFHLGNLSALLSFYSQSSSQEFKYNFATFFHPFVGTLLQRLNESASFADMLAPEFLGDFVSGGKQTIDYNSEYYDTSVSTSSATPCQVNFPSGAIDVGIGGPYAVYNWELFYHIPVGMAVHLSSQQRFAEAHQMFHLVFDPSFRDDSNTSPIPFWKSICLRQPDLLNGAIDNLSYAGTDAGKLALKNQILAAFLQTPFDPYAVARNRPLAFQYYVVMKYLDNLIAWGDSLFLQNTIETINEATMCYVLAANLLGPRPQKITMGGRFAPKSYADLKSKGIDALGDAIVDLEAQFPFNVARAPGQGGGGILHQGGGGTGNQGGDGGTGGPLFGTVRSLYFCIPPNPTLLAYWDVVADRLFKIRHCENLAGMVEQLPLFDPPIDPGMLVKATAAGFDIGSIVSGLNQPIGPIRALPRIQKALELASEVRSLGNALLSSIEKQEAEHLAVLRQTNEVELQKKTQNVRFLQWKQAQEATQSLLRTRATALERFGYYLSLLNQTPDPKTAPNSLPPIDGALDLTEDTFDTLYHELVAQYDLTITPGQYPPVNFPGSTFPVVQSGASSTGQLYLNKNEDAELNTFLPAGRDKGKDASELHAGAAALTIMPDASVDAHYWGIGFHGKVFGGDLLAAAVRIGADVMQMIAAYNRDQAGMAARNAGHQRRVSEWTLQANLAARELMQIGRQVIASLIAEQVAKHEFDVAQTQSTQAQAVQQYMQTKFTNEDLYAWTRDTLTTLYYQYYRLAVDQARKAEQTLKQELMRPELDATSFIQFNYWDSGRQGLLSGEALYLDVKRMELAYYDSNARELELTRHISLRQLDPMALLALNFTGSCTFTIPEWFFDRECPGHYMRRIKTVALSLPSLVGAYTTVNCTLTLQSSSIRTSAFLSSGSYARQGSDDDRFVDYFGAVIQS